MVDYATPFVFDYPGVKIRYGPESVDRLATDLEGLGASRALLVSGSTVGSVPAVVDPVTAGMGNRLAGTFAETTPEKTLEMALRGVERMRELEADAIVSLGGGSSLDVAKVMSAIAIVTRRGEDIRQRMVEEGRITLPDRLTRLTPIVAIPTTLAGADLSIAGSVNAGVEGDQRSGYGSRVSVSEPTVMPAVGVYDPKLFATTPRGVLAASAMNGFNKGVETLYSRNATPITDATASLGLETLQSGLRDVGEGEMDEDAMERLVTGAVLVQYGHSRPGGKTLSIIHAFGHGFSRNYDIHQGRIHGVLAPHVLRYLFEQVDGRRRMLADALGVDTDGASDQAVAEGIVEAVEGTRDALGLDSRLRSIDGLGKSDLPAVADAILADGFLKNGPVDFAPTREGVSSVLSAAW